MRNNKGFETKYDEFIETHYNSINRRINKIKINQMKEDRLYDIKRDMSKSYLYIAISKYSAGYNISSLESDLLSAIELCHESWVDNAWKLKTRDGKVFNQYILSAYDEMLWMLSLGYMLDIPNVEFEKLIDVIDRDQIKDFLFEFIIKAKIPQRKLVEEESYKEDFGVPRVFEKLRKVLNEDDKSKAENLIKEFITKDWYKRHKGAGWANNHKSIHNVYFGYWSFGTAIVVCVKDLDDSSFRENKYYPKDLSDYCKRNCSSA